MEKKWYYSADGQEKKGPVPEHELQRLLTGNQIPTSTLVWSEGLANWVSASSVAALQAPTALGATLIGIAATPASASGNSTALAGLGWMTFVGVVHIIMGVFACLSCIGLIYGVPMIMGGAALLGAKNLLSGIATVDAPMNPFLEKLLKSFKLVGWGYILMFIATILFMIIYFAFIVVLISKLGINLPH
ncbi:MAG: DUF4339 domain-containing protein [Verrucomicrobia bacterium]|nr:MAG: DUF4339 domain-containing protein [Verrucomicrobiota bacterium]